VLISNKIRKWRKQKEDFKLRWSFYCLATFSPANFPCLANSSSRSLLLSSSNFSCLARSFSRSFLFSCNFSCRARSSHNFLLFSCNFSCLARSSSRSFLVSFRNFSRLAMKLVSIVVTTPLDYSIQALPHPLHVVQHIKGTATKQILLPTSLAICFDMSTAVRRG